MSEAQAPAIVPRDCILVWTRALNAAAAAALLLCAIAFAIAIVLTAQESQKDLFFYAGHVVRVYGIALAALLVLVETEWRLVLRLVPLLEAWAGRGLCHLFLAALTFREAASRQDGTDFAKSMLLLRGVASTALLGCGCLYCAGGVVCMGTVRRARQRRQEEYVAAETEYEELGRRRGELERLLGRPAEL